MNLQDAIEKLRANGASDEQVAEFIHNTIPANSMIKMGDGPGQLAQTVSKYGHTILPPVMGGFMGGVAASAGTAIGTPALGAALAPVGVGLGHNAGDVTMRTFDYLTGIKEPPSMSGELAMQAKDVAHGAALEAAAQTGLYLVTKGTSAIAHKLAPAITKAVAIVRKDPAEKQVGKILHAWFGDGEGIIAHSAKEAQAIERTIGHGFKFSTGQAENATNVLQKARGAIRSMPRGGEALAQHIRTNREAIEAYLKEQNVLGTADDIAPVITEAGKQAKEIKGALGAATGQLDDIAVAALKADHPQYVGKRLFETLLKRYGVQREAAGKLYQELPSKKIKADWLLRQLRKLEADHFYAGHAPKSLPEHLLKRIYKLATESTKAPSDNRMRPGEGEALGEAVEEIAHVAPTLTMEQLTNFYSAAGKEMQQAYKTGENILGSRFKQIRDWIKTVIEEGESADGKAPEAWRKARKAWSEMMDTYGTSPVSDVLSHGAYPGGLSMPYSEMPGQFFKDGSPEAAQALIRAAGMEEAKQQIRQYALYKLNKEAVDAVTGELSPKSLKKWVAKYRDVLDTFGLGKEFENYKRIASEALESASKAKAFEQSALSAALKADPEKVIPAMFSGRNGTDSARTAMQLLQQVSRNPEAVEGLKGAFTKYLIDAATKTAEGYSGAPEVSAAAMTKLLARYRPALQVLFHNEPARLKALETVQRAYVIAMRGATGIPGGSDTAENLLQQVVSGIAPFLFKRWALARGVSLITGKAVKLGEKQAEKVLLKALFDPRYAKELVDSYVSMDKQAIWNAINKGVAENPEIVADFARRSAMIAGALEELHAGEAAKKISDDFLDKKGLEMSTIYNIPIPTQPTMP